MRTRPARRLAPLPFPGVGPGDLEAAREALERIDFEGARERFAAALARHECAEGFFGLGESLIWLGRTREAIDAWNRSFQLATRDDDTRAAARAAIHVAVAAADALGEDMLARGWLRRARMVLDRLPEPVPEHAWLTVWEAHFAFFDGDAAMARSRVDEATELGRRFGIVDVEMQALGLDGLLRVASGSVEDGLRLLDTATAAAISGELSARASNGQVCCYQLRACEQLHAFDRASRWLNGIRAHASGVALTLSFCRSHHAKILIWRGDWVEAEAELTAAIVELGGPAPVYLPLLRGLLGELRRRQGRIEEAEALLVHAEGVPQAAFCRAAIALSRGDWAATLDLVDRGLRRLCPDDRVGRAPGLDLAIRARCAQGDTETAATLVTELEEIADAAASDGLRAVVASARGHLAMALGDVESARRAFEDAVDLFDRAGSPHEAGLARLGLADALVAGGREAGAAEETERARAAFEVLGAAADLRRAEEVAAQLARPASGGAAACGLTERQTEVLRLVAAGLSNRQIGARLHLSEHTVKRHVADILTRLDLSSRAAAAAFAAQRGLTGCC